MAAPSNDNGDSGPDRAADGDVLLLEHFLPYRLSYLSMRVSGALASLYGKMFCISAPEWRVLATIGLYGKITARDVSTTTSMHKTMVSRAVTNLVNRHFIERTANPTDKRQIFLEMRPKGRNAYQAIIPEARRFSERLEIALTDEERRVLYRAIDALRRRLDEMEREDATGA
jgi:DNA-binding MarR family transcriptional regulator